MSADRVSVGFIHPGDVAGDFAQSLAHTVLRDRNDRRINNVIQVQSSPRVSEGRSQVVDGFLHQTNDDWLFMVDADMSWEWEAFDLLCRHADQEQVPIIGGLCFGGGRSWEGGHPKIFPTIYKFVKQDDSSPGIEVVDDYPRDELIPVGATGAAFLMVHRSVFCKMKVVLAKTPDGHPNPFPWFAEVINRGRPVGEDITFCMRAQACGFPIHVHTGARVGHRKSMTMTEDTYDMVRRA